MTKCFAKYCRNFLWCYIENIPTCEIHYDDAKIKAYGNLSQSIKIADGVDALCNRDLLMR